MSRYLEWASKPSLAQALSLFKSEREIRKTGRLDLVTWVQYICAFGYAGPTDEAWANLFAACRVLPMLQPNPVTLREHEIAVLLAYAKIKPDNGDTMTPAQLVKHRIKPAVLGRTVARTPGILQHIHQKFETWALGPFTDMYFRFTVSNFGPSNYLPGTDDLPTALPEIGDCIRVCADAHANNMLKLWGNLVTTILDIENDTTSQRAVRFEQKLHEKRKYIYQHIFIKISEHLFNQTQSPAFLPVEQKLQYKRYREAPSAQPSDNDRFIFANEKPGSLIADFIKRVVTTTPPSSSFPAWSLITAHVTICELHKPGRYGQAGLDFLQSDDIHRDVIKVKARDVDYSFSASKTRVRIGSFNSATIAVDVHGVPPSQMCRALRLELRLGVLPPRPGSTKPRFQIVDIKQATWVELSEEEDQCIERDPMSEMGMEHDVKEDEDEKDKLHQWCLSSGIGKYLQLAAGVHWVTFDLCEGMTKHDMKVEVPEELLRRVRLQGKVAEQTSPAAHKPGMKSGLDDIMNVSESTFGSCASIDMDVDTKGTGSEIFHESCWIDCHTGAQLTYIAPPGVELLAATPKKKGIFANAPCWKSRTP